MGYFWLFIFENWEVVKTVTPLVLAALFIAVGLTWLHKARKHTWDEEKRRLRLGATICLSIGAFLICAGIVLYLL